MPSHFPRSIALMLALWSAGSVIALAQPRAKGAAHLTVSVTVSPICTVAVTPGEWSADEAVDVHCRNFSDRHPDPLISDAEPAISENLSASTDPITMVVIHF